VFFPESQTVDNHPRTRPPPGFTSELTVLLLEVCCCVTSLAQLIETLAHESMSALAA